MDLLVSLDQDVLIVSQGVGRGLIAMPHRVNALRELEQSETIDTNQ
jgi:hypothetical protein